MSNLLVSPSLLAVRAGPVRSRAAAVALAVAAGCTAAPMLGDPTVRKGAGGR